jgi:hypothetical protein
MLEKKRTKQSAKHSVRGDGIMDKSSHEDGHDEGAQESKYETLHTHVNECGNVTSMRPAGLSALCWRFRVLPRQHQMCVNALATGSPEWCALVAFETAFGAPL